MSIVQILFTEIIIKKYKIILNHYCMKTYTILNLY